MNRLTIEDLENIIQNVPVAVGVHVAQKQYISMLEQFVETLKENERLAKIEEKLITWGCHSPALGPEINRILGISDAEDTELRCLKCGGQRIIQQMISRDWVKCECS